MNALVGIGVLKEFKKEIFWLIVLIIGIVLFFQVKKKIEANTKTAKINEVVKGSKEEDKILSETLSVDEARVSVLRAIANKVAFNLGTLPTQNTWFNTEDEEAVIYELSKLNSTAEILAVSEFYDEMTSRSLRSDLNSYLSNSDLSRVELYSSL